MGYRTSVKHCSLNGLQHSHWDVWLVCLMKSWLVVSPDVIVHVVLLTNQVLCTHGSYRSPKGHFHLTQVCHLVCANRTIWFDVYGQDIKHEAVHLQKFYKDAELWFGPTTDNLCTCESTQTRNTPPQPLSHLTFVTELVI